MNAPIARPISVVSKAFGPGKPLTPPLRVCKNCEFYREHVDMKNHGLGTCTLFGHIDLVTGAQIFESASVARALASMCGPEGVHYSPRTTND